MMLPTIVVLLVPLIAAVLYRPIATQSALNNRTSAADSILLVTAHPDDECMFFAPTILGLQGIDSPPDIRVVSLSIGNADGLGEKRHNEFHASLSILGIPETNRFIVDHPDLQDDITIHWNPEVVSTVLGFYIEQYNVTKVLTFDYIGISGHRNHKSVFHGMRHHIRTTAAPPKLYALVTVPVFSKYATIVAPFQAKFDLYSMDLMHYLELHVMGTLHKLGFADEPKEIHLTDAMPVFVAGFDGVFTAQRAMLAHWSQMVWFRWVYILFSRYMWVNEWHEIPA